MDKCVQKLNPWGVGFRRTNVTAALASPTLASPTLGFPRPILSRLGFPGPSFLALAFAALAFTGCASGSEAMRSTTGPGGSESTSAGDVGEPIAVSALPDPAADFVAALNEERASRNLETLEPLSTLTQAAEDYACVMANQNHFDHVGPNGSSFQERMCDAGFGPTCNGVGTHAENIAAGNVTGNAVFEAWMNSDGHRKNMLNGDMRALGVARCENTASTFRYYWTLVLSSER